jgi:hypothetical protein
MGAEGTQGRARPDASTRLRLVDVVTSVGTFPFGGGLSCVLAGADDRAQLALDLANAMIGPRGSDVDGTVEIAGRLVALPSLPAPLLAPSAARTINRALLEQIWRSACARHRADIESEHAARRLERHRSEAALEQAHLRARALAERSAPVISVAVPEPDPTPELRPPQSEPEPEPDPMSDVAPRIESLLAELARLEPVESEEACRLADEFDDLAARERELEAQRKREQDEADVDMVALQQRVAAARYAVADRAGGVTPEARARIEAAHRDVVVTESELFEARRKDRAGALTAYQAALAAEHIALTGAGVDSYAAFLVAIARGAPPVDPEVRLRAELELADAEAALERARRARGLESERELSDQELQLRSLAAQLLRHLPGDDPAGELRDLRVEHPDAQPLRDELRTLLATARIYPTGDLVAAAIAALEAHEAHAAQQAAAAALAEAAPPVVEAEPAPARAPEVPAAPEAPPVGSPELLAEQQALNAETEALASECEAHERALADLEQQLADLDRLRDTDLSQLDPTSMQALFDALLDAYRAGDLLAGRLPLVLDGALDALSPALVAANLAAVTDVQVVVVTAEVALADALDRAGAVVIGRGGAPSRAAAAGHPSVPRATTAAPCASHPAKESAARCAQCGKPCCVDCLVYVPGEPELWCVGCADAMRSRNLRLLRRRGA